MLRRRDILLGDLSNRDRKAAIGDTGIVLGLLLAAYLLWRSRSVLRGVKTKRTMVFMIIGNRGAMYDSR